MASLATLLYKQEHESRNTPLEAVVEEAKAASGGRKKGMLDIPTEFHAVYLKGQLKGQIRDIDQKVRQVTQVLLRMEQELRSLDKANLARKDIIALKINSMAIVAKLEFLKTFFAEGSEGLSKEEPNEYTYSPYEKFMNEESVEVDRTIKQAVREIEVIDLAEGLDLDEELKEKVVAHKKNLQLLKPVLGMAINSRGSAIAHIESILAIFNGMHDRRRDEEGIFEIVDRKLKAITESGFTDPSRADKLKEMIAKANEVIEGLSSQRTELEAQL